MPGDQQDDQSYGQVEETARPMGHAELAVRHAIAAYSRRLGICDVDVNDVAGGEGSASPPPRKIGHTAAET